MQLNWFPNLVLLIFGLVFTIEALSIPTDEDSIGARLVPLWTSVILVVLVLLQMWNDRKASNSTTKIIDNSSPEVVSSGMGIIRANELMFSSLPLILLMGVYGVFYLWFGYLISTLLSGAMAFLLFRNSPFRTVVHSVIGAAVLYVLFIKLLGIYDPPGALIDISGL